MSKILIVEDDPATAVVVKELLEAKGHSVDVTKDAIEAMSYATNYTYSLIILDWHLDKRTTGIDFLKSYRAKNGNALVMMTTSRGHIDDKETGFEAGADDYLPKPFLGKELVLRVEALLRRGSDGVRTDNIIQVGKLKVDTSKHLAFAGDQELALRPKEFALLEHLLRHSQQVFSADDLLNAVWPSDNNSSYQAVRVTITRLRQAVLDAINEDPIETLHGVGYRLRA